MPTVKETMQKYRKDEFSDDLKKSAEKLIKDYTGATKTLVGIKDILEISVDSDTFVGVYNTANKTKETATSFKSPAFSAGGKIYLNPQNPDWSINPVTPDELKIASTIIHEYYHSQSHNGRGLQKVNDKFGLDKEGGYSYADEVVTDLCGYLSFAELALGIGNYKTGYICPGKNGIYGDHMTVGALGAGKWGWLSIVLTMNLFDGKRKNILKTYFNGDDLADGQCKSMSAVIQAMVKVTDAAPNYGLPFGIAGESGGKTKNGKSLQPFLALTRITSSVIDTSFAAAIRKVLADDKNPP